MSFFDDLEHDLGTAARATERRRRGRTPRARIVVVASTFAVVLGAVLVVVSQRGDDAPAARSLDVRYEVTGGGAVVVHLESPPPAGAATYFLVVDGTRSEIRPAGATGRTWSATFTAVREHGVVHVKVLAETVDGRLVGVSPDESLHLS